MLPVNPDINRGWGYDEFHRSNEKQVSELIDRCKPDQTIQYVTTGFYGDEWKQKKDYYGKQPFNMKIHKYH
jgi:hypothetical protein